MTVTDLFEKYLRENGVVNLDQRSAILSLCMREENVVAVADRDLALLTDSARDVLVSYCAKVAVDWLKEHGPGHFAIHAMSPKALAYVSLAKTLNQRLKQS